MYISSSQSEWALSKNLEPPLPASLDCHLYLYKEGVEFSYTKSLTYSKYIVALFGLIMLKNMISEKFEWIMSEFWKKL